MCKHLIQIEIISLVLFLGSAEGEKLWNGVSSVTAVQGQSVTMQWMVNLTLVDSSKAWTYAKIIQVQDGKTTDLISLQKSGTKTINDPKYQSRASDLNLNVSQIAATVIIKFTMNNLLTWMDEKHYKTMLGFASDSSTFPTATSLIILERPHSTRISASPNQTAYCINDTFTITCVSRARPNAKYSLYRDNELVQSGVSNGLFVVSAALTDRVYTCVPYNTVGTGQNASFPLHVKEPPKILRCKINDVNTTNNTFVEGAKVTLMCKMSGSEPMDVTWVRINASPPLSWNKRSLAFNAIRREEDGWYRITINNGKECNTTASVTFHVKVNYKPVDTSISVLPKRSMFCLNEQIVITCKTEAKPAPEYSLYQNNQLIQRASKSGSFRMPLLFKGEIIFHCIPSNAVGSGQTKNLRVFVKEPPSIARCKVANQDQSSITVSLGAKVSFECEFSGTRPLNVTWTKEGPTVMHWNQWNLTINPVQRDDGGIYKVTVYNGEECGTAVTRIFSLVVSYMSKPQVVGNNFNVFNKSTTQVNFEILIDAYPDVSLTCKSAQLKEQSIFVQRNKKGSTKNQFIVTANTTHVDKNVRLKCTAANEVDSKTTRFLIYKQVVAKIFAGSMKLVGQHWRQELSDINSKAYKILWTKSMKMLYDVYNEIPYVQKWDVLRFTSGSVVLNFQLHVIADVADPNLPLRIAVDKNGGFVGDQEVDPTSIKKENGAHVEAHEQSNTSTNIVAALVVIVVLCLLIIIILAVQLLRVKAASRKESRHEYDDPDLAEDGMPLQDGRPLPAVPKNDTQGVVGSRDSTYDYCYQHPGSQPSDNQPQANTGRNNPILNQHLPQNRNQAHDISLPLTEEEEESKEGVEADERISQRTTKNEVRSESLQPHQVESDGQKKYNRLDPSTRLPPRNRPALGQGHEIQLLSSDVNHGYQNQETTEEKPPKAGETRESSKANENKLQRESLEGYNQAELSRTTKPLIKESRPVAKVDQNQKAPQIPRISQDNKAFVVDEKEPQEFSNAKSEAQLIENIEDSAINETAKGV